MSSIKHQALLRLHLPALVLSAAFLLPTPPAAAASGGPDSYGYIWKDRFEPGGPAYQWVDISGTGAKILEPGAAAKANLELNPPLVIYGHVAPEITVSRNGYISTDPTESGGDETNDCPLPSAVSSGGGHRIYVLHDALRLGAGTGAIYHEYFPVSPHSWHPGGVHVITWHDVTHSGDTTKFSFQVLLFDNFDILMQFRAGDPESGANATTGIQNALASVGMPGASGIAASCNSTRAASWAVVFQPPIEIVALDTDPALSLIGTLRHRITTARAGSRLEFAPALSGATIDFGAPGSNGGMLTINKPLALDASALAEPVTLLSHPSPTGTIPPVFFLVQSHLATHDVRFRAPDPSSGTYAISSTAGSGFSLAMHNARIEGPFDFAILTPPDTSNRLRIVGSTFPANRISIQQTSHPNSNRVDIHHSTLTGNQSPAIRAFDGCTLNISDSSLSANLSNAIRATGSVKTVIRRSIFALNIDTAIDAELGIGGFLQVYDSSFTANVNVSSASGGAIRMSGATLHSSTLPAHTLILHRCTFAGNRAAQSNSGSDRGGAILLIDAKADIRECTFSGNSAWRGGAIRATAANDAEIAIRESTFDNNSATGDGSAISSEVPVKFTRSTISGNGGPNTLHIKSAGGNYLDTCTVSGNAGTFASLEDAALGVSHSIFDHAGPASQLTGAASMSSGGYTLSPQSHPFLGGPTDLPNTDPLLGPLAYNGGPTRTHALLSGSPAIDAIPFGSGVIPGTDQRGFPRPVDGAGNGILERDIGSYEYQGAVVVTTSIDENVDPGTGVSLREALDLVSDGGVITFAGGLSGATSILGSTLQITRDVTIDASNLTNPFALSGNAQRQAARVSNASVTFRNINFVDGLHATGSGKGAGLEVAGSSTVSLEACNFRRNKAGGGGGGLAVGPNASVVFTGGNISGNSTVFSLSSHGGGVLVDSGGSLLLRRVQVNGNSTLSQGNGGGIHFTGGGAGQLLIDRCAILENTAGQDGGGLYLDGSAPATIRNTTISGNVAASNRGGAAFSNGLIAELRHCTVVNNRSNTGAGGLHNLPGASLRANHSILAANRNAAGPANTETGRRVFSFGYNLADDKTTLTTGPQSFGDIRNRAPLLGPLAHYGGPFRSHAPLAISPVIDAGDPHIADAPSFDVRGFARTQAGIPGGSPRIDIGAVEAGEPIVVTSALDAPTGSSLREAIAAAAPGQRILFDRSLNNAVIEIAQALTPLVIDKPLQIDATTLDRGIQIDGGLWSPCVEVTQTGTAALHAVNLRNGRYVTPGGSDFGGAARSFGLFTFTHGAMRNNRAEEGGGALAVLGGETLLFNATLANNQTDGFGGAAVVSGGGSLRLFHTTIAHNSSTASGPGTPGGIHLGNGRLLFSSSIIAENTNADGLFNFAFADLNGLSDRFISRGHNLTDTSSAVVVALFNQPGDQPNTPAQINALGNNGGWSPTVSTQPGSPARNAGNPQPDLIPVFDGRGRLRVAQGVIDIGAFEALGANQDSDGDGMPDWWEIRHGLDPANAADAALDNDLDGINNLDEYLGGTDPNVPDSLVVPTVPVILFIERSDTPGWLEITFASDPGRLYTVERSLDHIAWSPLGTVAGAPGTVETTFLVDTGNDPRGYFRLHD